MKITIDVDLRALAEQIGEQLSYSETLELIKALDAGMQEYEFTETVAKYAIAELMKECAAGGDAFDISDLMPKAVK